MTYDFHTDQDDWLEQQVSGWTSSLSTLSPSEWAERRRYLPASVGPMPGFFRFSVTPYMREILDCMSPDSPVREVAVMKGVQIAFTTAVLENILGYLIDHIKTASSMLVTADNDLAKARMEQFILPMLQASDLMHLIKSSDESSNRKTGKTDKKLEWVGGGFALPIGAQNPNRFRSIPVQYLLCDEPDGWPDVVGKSGDPVELVIGRTKAYEATRKILFGSTPTLEGTSKIYKRFLRTDQRRYYVRCLRCGFAQVLRWRRTDKDTGVTVSGIIWETDGDRLVPDSVRYLCENCQHPHLNEDKTRLLDPSHGAEWRPTAEPATPFLRGYHIPALISPVGMQSWAACVYAWRDAWDDDRNELKDPTKLQVFYNEVLGETFRPLYQNIRFEIISAHRRGCYRYGEIPNTWAAKHCGSPVLILTCAVDVHKGNLAVAVFGWCRDRRALLVEYVRLEGNCEDPDDPDSWGRLRELIDGKEWVADDGKRYRVEGCFIDSSYLPDTVYDFARDFPGFVAPIKGRDLPPKSAAMKEFAEIKTEMGVRGYLVTVDLYKDRWATYLKRSWDGHSVQPVGYFNAPSDATDDQLKELTRETRRERVEERTGRTLGYFWHRPSGAKNELWDLLVYNNAALELIAWGMAKQADESISDLLAEFWDLIEQEQTFFLAA